MGYEQRFRFTGQSAASLDAILQAAPHFARYVPEHRVYEYRSDRNADLHWMPDAHAMIEADGVYFCDNGASHGSRSVSTAVREYLRAVVERTRQPFDLRDVE